MTSWPTVRHGVHSETAVTGLHPCHCHQLARVVQPCVQATGFIDEATGKNRTVPFELMVQGDKVRRQLQSCPLYCPGRCVVAGSLLTTPNSVHTWRCNTHSRVISVPKP